MKTTLRFPQLTLGLAAIMACGLLTASVLDRTAFELAKEGNKYIVEQSRDKVVQIRSEKSSRSTTPSTWYVVYFESLKSPSEGSNLRFATGTELKFTAGNLVNISRNVRIFDADSDKYVEIDPSMMSVDSDRALGIALKEPVLESLKVMSTSMTLEQGTEGVPVWKVTIWAAKKDTKIDLNVGEIWVSSVDGKVTKITINPGRVG